MIHLASLLTAIFLHYVGGHVVLDLSDPLWSVYNANQSIATQGPVPGGVFSTLEDKAYIGDILFGNNDVEYRWIGKDDWSYYREFELNSTYLNYPITELVLHGIDTYAEVFMNNQHVTSCSNMFVRYNTDIKSIIKEGKNNITIMIKSPVNTGSLLASKLGYSVPPACHPPSYNGECNINMLRKMQAAYAWDWGPAFPSLGVWKPVELVLSEGPVIRSVGVSTASEGAYWRLNVSVWFDPSDLKLKDTLSVQLYNATQVIFVSQKKVYMNRKLGDEPLVLSFLIAKEKVKKWWPNGYGEQTLYDLRVLYAYSEKTVRMGFRTVELIQENVSQDEKQGKTFYFKVNGVRIFAKGSNWIPSHVLPERLSEPSRVVPLLEAAADAHFNMLRVWGGGVYESQLFYETCDRLGILVWEDLMFACSMYPSSSDFLRNVREEVKQQVQRLQHHPSIAIWAGNNENEAALVQNWYGTANNFSIYKSDYIKLYVDTIMPVVRKVDPSRAYVTSSPSNGVETVREGYLASNPQNTLYGDVHYYNYLSNGWDYRIFPNPRFASEYGVQSLPSLRCLRAALPLGELKWTSQFLGHRQHAPGGNAIIMNQISMNLPQPNKIEDIIYMSQINQAMTMKVESEKYRRLKSVLLDSGEGYTSGALYWQLNDIWQAPSWSSIDYCGHKKMLHYFAKEFFAPIIISPELSSDGNTISVYVVIDGTSKFRKANATLNVYNMSSQIWNPIRRYTLEKEMVDNESFLVLQMPLADVQAENHVLTTSLVAGDQPIAPENFLFLSALNTKNYPESSVKISGHQLVDELTMELTLSADKYAFFVWLDADGLDGDFSRNGFHMLQPTMKVTFKSKNPMDESSLQKISVTWLRQSY